MPFENKEQVIEYLEKHLDQSMEKNIRDKLGNFGYSNTWSIRHDVKEFESVMKYLKENLK